MASHNSPFDVGLPAQDDMLLMQCMQQWHERLDRQFAHLDEPESLDPHDWAVVPEPATVVGPAGPAPF